jgi:hypothetical protein
MMADARLQQQSYQRIGQRYGQVSDHDGYATSSLKGSKRDSSSSMNASLQLNESASTSGLKRAASSDVSVEEARENSSGIVTETGNSSGASRKKQKRNKPTLSCAECVERKTKVSRLDYKSNC